MKTKFRSAKPLIGKPGKTNVWVKQVQREQPVRRGKMVSYEWVKGYALVDEEGQVKVLPYFASLKEAKLVIADSDFQNMGRWENREQQAKLRSLVLSDMQIYLGVGNFERDDNTSKGSKAFKTGLAKLIRIAKLKWEDVEKMARSR